MRLQSYISDFCLAVALSGFLTGCGVPAGGEGPGDCEDGVDNDFDGSIDCDDGGCSQTEACGRLPESECNDDIDNDADGAADCDDPDCAGRNRCEEVEGANSGECRDGLDNDSDGFVDCDDVSCQDSPACTDDTVDLDEDGVADADDCDDRDAAVGAIVSDSDCDGALNTVDCDDSDPAVYPGAAEVCDAEDSDCDGSIADAFPDFDGDDAPDCVDAPAPGDGLAHPTFGTLRYIPAGTFTMGCVVGRDDVAGYCSTDETPAHTVTLTQASWMMESELTQAMWSTFGYANPSRFVGSDRPVEYVVWWDAVEAANAASARDGLSACYALSGCSGTVGSNRACTSVTLDPACTGWRLPTEAEWEYAARGGESFPYAGASNLDAVAWHNGNSADTTHPSCGKQRNGFGLCDMTGNVDEWVGDWYGDYASGSVTDPLGQSAGSERVYRGGSYDNYTDQRAQVSYRDFGRIYPAYYSNRIGFRLLRSVP